MTRDDPIREVTDLEDEDEDNSANVLDVDVVATGYNFALL